jgi:hypothetical protein
MCDIVGATLYPVLELDMQAAVMKFEIDVCSGAGSDRVHQGDS